MICSGHHINQGGERGGKGEKKNTIGIEHLN
jgi:hypothetical protein